MAKGVPAQSSVEKLVLIRTGAEADGAAFKAVTVPYGPRSSALNVSAVAWVVGEATTDWATQWSDTVWPGCHAPPDFLKAQAHQ